MTMERLASDAQLSGPRRYAVNWGDVEAAIGTRLPADYKEFVYWFGPGCFEEYLFICVPGIENSNMELVARLAQERSGAQLRVQHLGLPPGVPLFPEPGGWLPWGFTTGGDALYWVTSSDDPDDWTVAGRPGRGEDRSYFDGGFAAFMHAYIWDTVDMPFLSEAEEEIPVAFESLDGTWPPGSAGERLQPYGRFETD